MPGVVTFPFIFGFGDSNVILQLTFYLLERKQELGVGEYEQGS